MTINIDSWAGLVPLVGGQNISAEKLTNKKPEFNMTYEGFWGNEQYLSEGYYANSVPYVNLGESTYDNCPLHHNPGQVDLIVSTTPCSGLSGSNRQAQYRGKSTCHLFNALEYVTKVSKPKLAVFEQAPVLFSATSDKGVYTRKDLDKISSDNDFTNVYFKADTSFYGVPQIRPRTYLVAFRNDQLPEIYREDRLVKLGDKSWRNNTTPLVEYIKRADNTEREIAKARESFKVKNHVINVVEDYFGVSLFELQAQTTKGVHDLLIKNGYLDENNAEAFCGHLNQVSEDFIEVSKRYPEGRMPGDVRSLDNIIKYIFKLGGKKPFGYFGINIMGSHFSNVLFQQSIQFMCHPSEKRNLTSREVALLMGMPKWFQDNAEDIGTTVLTQNVTSTTTLRLLEEITK